ncbi:MAG: class F sortase [Acidobacteriota bacterium]|nr:class F sortase [Acidobacteriota bacterium]
MWVPQIGVSASVGVLGLNKDNTVQVPTNFAQPGWYKFGPAPGQQGSAVILGHVDNYKGPAVFFYVYRLRLGSPVIVKLADGYTVRFKVIGVREYTKNQFPDQLVYGMRPYSALQLVTCGGVFDRATGHYESNIVAFTTMTGWTPPPKK